jgi:hypothetical protein
MSLLDELRESWNWAGLEPAEIIGENDFGNLLIRDTAGRIWRLCPEDCYCRIVAMDVEQLATLAQNAEFMKDWHMQPLVEEARTRCGPLREGRKYNLRLPGLLGGQYGGDNLGITTQVELIRASARVAKSVEREPLDPPPNNPSST